MGDRAGESQACWCMLERRLCWRCKWCKVERRLCWRKVKEPSPDGGRWGWGRVWVGGWVGWGKCGACLCGRLDGDA